MGVRAAGAAAATAATGEAAAPTAGEAGEACPAPPSDPRPRPTERRGDVPRPAAAASGEAAAAAAGDVAAMDLEPLVRSRSRRLSSSAKSTTTSGAPAVAAMIKPGVNRPPALCGRTTGRGVYGTLLASGPSSPSGGVDGDGAGGRAPAPLGELAAKSPKGRRAPEAAPGPVGRALPGVWAPAVGATGCALPATTAAPAANNGMLTNVVARPPAPPGENPPAAAGERRAGVVAADEVAGNVAAVDAMLATARGGE